MREQADLDQALRGTLALDAPARRLSRLLEFLDPTDPEGIHARLARWCAVDAGRLRLGVRQRGGLGACRGWRAQPLIGFDVTEFLDHELTRAPVTLYLFHLVRQLLDGRRLVCWMDEFWRLLADPAFESFAKDGPKTWRKLNGVMCLATQSASDVLESPISRTIIEQTPTKIFFPNADASAAGVHGRLRPQRARVQAHQGAARARLAHVPGQAGASQRRLPARSARASMRLAVISGRAQRSRAHASADREHGRDPITGCRSFMARARPAESPITTTNRRTAR